MKNLFLPFILLFLSVLTRAQEQKIVGDCTVTYSISSNQSATNSNLSGAVKTLYIKGKIIRVDMSSSAFAQSVIYNTATGEAVILKELSGNKFLTKIDAQEWKQQNSRYDGLRLAYSTDTKTILGYECKKGTATLKDGSSFSFYYAVSIMPSATENPYQFKDIPGFVLQYEIMGEDKTSKITYTATRINFNPVPVSKFDTPTTGYRILNNQ
jgi:GLPGLI family protein